MPTHKHNWLEDIYMCACTCVCLNDLGGAWGPVCGKPSWSRHRWRSFRLPAPCSNLSSCSSSVPAGRSSADACVLESETNRSKWELYEITILFRWMAEKKTAMLTEAYLWSFPSGKQFRNPVQLLHTAPVPCNYKTHRVTVHNYTCSRKNTHNRKINVPKQKRQHIPLGSS